MESWQDDLESHRVRGLLALSPVLINRLATAHIYMRVRQRTIQPVIPQLATAGVYSLAGDRTDHSGLGEVSGTGDSGQQ